MSRYFVVGHQGLEEQMLEELKQKVNPTNVRVVPRVVAFDSDASPSTLTSLKSITRICSFVVEAEAINMEDSKVKQLKQVRDAHTSSKCDWDGAYQTMVNWRKELGSDCTGSVASEGKKEDEVSTPSSPPSFRVTMARRGEHRFKSPDAQGTIGGAVLDRNAGWTVNLKTFDIEVWSEVFDSHIFSGISLKEDFDLRHRSPSATYSPKTALIPSFAYSVLQYLKPDDGSIIVDPMCGVGTIPIEGALSFPKCTFIGTDISNESLGAAKEHAAYCGLSEDRVSFRLDDACELKSLEPQTVDMIITDPPFGKVCMCVHFQLFFSISPSLFLYSLFVSFYLSVCFCSLVSLPTCLPVPK